MSCSDIKVTIIGDVASITVLVTQAQQAAAQSAASAVAAAASAVAAKAALDQIADTPVQLETGYNGTALSPIARAYDFKGSGVVVNQFSPGEFDIIIDGDKLPIDIGDVTGLAAALSQIESEKIDEITGDVDGDAKTLAIKMWSRGKIIKTNTFNLSAMFGRVAPTAQNVYAGFSGASIPSEALIKQGKRMSVSVVHGLDVSITRIDADQKYLFAWIPDVFGDVSGFKFSGTFVDVWQSHAVTVDSVPGKVYVSDNRTSAKSVDFEVEQ
jgi:hypothetical protein